MQITIKGRHIDVTDALKEYASKRVNKIERYFDHVISADVTLATERNWHIAEITVFGQGFDMRGRERSNDMYSSIDRVIDKLEQQIKRQKGKMINRRPGRGGAGADVPSAELEEKPRDRDGEKHEKYAPRVEHVKRFLAEPMTIDEAIKEMEASGFDFYCFLNSENGRVNVVYKRERGFGLIDPRLEEAGVV
ncbi:MAG: ribosome-associated translation inhibitor RaiA [Armatimonadetes bacterium]|nr:ribosome-associated translation inhibitor RaiA [Armatimonadota bacterium]